LRGNQIFPSTPFFLKSYNNSIGLFQHPGTPPSVPLVLQIILEKDAVRPSIQLPIQAKGRDVY
jgi:hypothetical protein